MLKKFALFLALAVTAFAISTDELVEKVRVGLGGTEALQALSGIKASGKSNQSGINGDYQVCWMAPNHYYYNFSFMMLNWSGGIDSLGPWSKGNVEVPFSVGGEEADDLYLSSFTTGWYCFHTDSGAIWEMLGSDKDGNHRLQMKLPDDKGLPVEFIIDKKTFLPLRLLVPHGVIQAVVDFKDYRKVAGVMLPFKEVTVAGGMDMSSNYQSVVTIGQWDESACNRPKSTLDYLLPNDKTTCKFTVVSRYLFCEGIVNGKGPYMFIVDTGSNGSGLVKSVADEVGVKSLASTKGTGIGGIMGLDLAKLDTFQIGDLIIKNKVIGVAPMQANFSRYLPNFKFGGIIGLDMLAPFVVQLSYERSTLDIYRPGTYKNPEGVNFTPFELSNGGICLAGKIEGKKAAMMLDSGASDNILLTTAYVNQEKFLEGRSTGITWFRGVGGVEEGKTGMISDMEICGFKLTAVPTDFSLTKKGAMGLTNLDANIGSGVLSRFDVIFDFPSYRIVFIPNKKFGEKFEPDRLGTMLVPHEKGMKIAKLDKNGSAAKAGLKEGDVITRIDDLDVNAKTMMEVRDYTLKPEGTVLRFTVRRSGKDDVIPVTLVNRF